MTGRMDSELNARLAFAHRLADAARAVIRPYFRRRIDVTDKGPQGFFDPVTDADKGAERIMRDMIANTYSADGIIGEEYGERSGRQRLRLGSRSDRRHARLHRRTAVCGER